MSDKFEILRLRRTKGSTPTFLQICWCAATKKNFVGPDDIYKVTSQEVESVNFIQLCSDIQKMLFNRESRVRFNLTIGSQLTYGTLRIFEYQTFSLEEKSDKLCSSMEFDFDCGSGQKDGRKKKNPKKIKSPIVEEQSFSIEDFSDIDINELFGGDEYRKDEHIIEEVDQFLNTELQYSFQESGDSSDLDKVMQELYEEMQRPQRRPRRAHPENLETNNPDILRQSIIRRSRRLSRASTSESAKTAVTPPSSQKSGISLQLQNSAFEGAPMSHMEQQFDEPLVDSEALPEAAMPNEPPLSQSSIVATTVLVTPPPPLPEINVTTDSADPQENFSKIEEGSEKININDNVIIDVIKQIELPQSTPSPHVHARKKPGVKAFWKKQTTAQMKGPTKKLLTIPSMSIGLGKTLTISKPFRENFFDIILKRERALKTSEVAAEFENVEESQRIDEEVMEHSLPKIIKTAKSKVNKGLNRGSDPDVPPDTAIPTERNEVEHPEGPFESQEPMETNNIEISECLVEDNVCENRRVANKTNQRKKSSSFSEDDREEEPKRKHFKAQETDEDSQSVKSKDDIYSKIKSFWRSMRASKGRKDANGKIKVAFKKIVPPAKNKISDVINCLTLCFHLESDRKINIEQEKPYDPLYLVKPST